jgi:glutaminyl-tRNA synthetase
MRMSDFIREMIAADVAAGKHGGKVVTRFPPEPNGYLHIGHAKSICLNFGVAQEFGGVCHLRMDDTNPAAEDQEYVDAIVRDVRWLGFDWADKMFYASDYYERLYQLAEKLIQDGKAYVCDIPDDEFSEKYRGSIHEPGKPSPFRNRSVEENLDLFRRMRAGEFSDGEKVLRAKIDMAAENLKMRDPAIYRIKKNAHHYRTGDAWCIYPLYDFAHCLSDSFEGITHSLCTMEFESARALYDWVIEATGVPHVPKQTEFARLNLSYTVMSKRTLLKLVTGKHVAGWDDPRMPTIAGLRRRGVTPEAIRAFAARIGVAKNLSVVDMALFEHVIREDLSPRAPRVLAVLDPVKLVVESFPEGETETFDAPYWPHDVPKEGTRKVPFSRELWIDRADFAEDPPKGWFRLAPGREVRLRHAYVVRCTGFEKDAAGRVVEIRCVHDARTRGGATPDGRKVDGTIQWVSAAHAVDAEVRVYDRLFSAETPGEGKTDVLEDLNPRSLVVYQAKLEPSLGAAQAGEHYQFERVGYFFVDPVDSKPGAPVFGRTVALKDGWAKEARKAEPPKIVEKRAHVARPASDMPRITLSSAAMALVTNHGLGAEEAHVIATTSELTRLFEGAAKAKPGLVKPVSVLLKGELLGELRTRKLERAPFDGGALAELVQLAEDGTISAAQRKEILAEMLSSGKAPAAIVEERGLRQLTSEGDLLPAVRAVLAKNEPLVAKYKAGNQGVLGALVGAVMKETGGRANAKVVGELLRKELA